MLQPLRAKSTRSKDGIESYQHGFTNGSMMTEEKMLRIFSHYCQHTLGATPKYGENWNTILQRHVDKHNLKFDLN